MVDGWIDAYLDCNDVVVVGEIASRRRDTEMIFCRKPNSGHPETLLPLFLAC